MNMESSKEEALLVLNGWLESETIVSVRIESSWINTDGFAGSILSADSECVEIGGPGLMLSVDFSSATAFTWGEREGIGYGDLIPPFLSPSEVYDGTPDVVCLCRFQDEEGDYSYRLRCCVKYILPN